MVTNKAHSDPKKLVEELERERKESEELFTIRAGDAKKLREEEVKSKITHFFKYVSAKPGKRTRTCFPGEMQRAIAEEMRREQLRRQYEDGKADIVGNALAV